MPTPASKEKQIEWKNLIEQQRHSGLSINKLCQRNQISQTTFHYWKDKFFPKQLQKSNFTELNIKRPDAISLSTQGIYVHISGDCDLNLRKQIFMIFSELTC